jgi:hypothetical protein
MSETLGWGLMSLGLFGGLFGGLGKLLRERNSFAIVFWVSVCLWMAGCYLVEKYG